VNQKTITGNWEQGTTMALQLNKVEKTEVIHKPQTPMPPFAYKTEDIIYNNIDGSIQYGATLTMPFGKGPFPAVILITGSGLQNRDEEFAGHKPFAVIADQLTTNGFAVLRVDDRGVGQTTGDVISATTLDFADDVNTGLNYLISLKEIDKSKLGLIGHSEGGMIAPILAARRKDICAIVLLAAPGKSTTEILIEQNEAVYSSTGLSKEYVENYMELYASSIRLIKNIADKEIAKNKLSGVVEEWINKTPPTIVAATTGIVNDNKKALFIESLVASFGSPWFQYFLNYEPQQFLEKLSCKVLAINGSRDIQIAAKSNLEGIEYALKNSKSKGYQIKEYEGLNHLFQKCKACTIQEYGTLEETISTDVLKDITAWLKEAM
jgi:pimeloyl-ACP methyl ester carboxylesterase